MVPGKKGYLLSSYPDALQCSRLSVVAPGQDDGKSQSDRRKAPPGRQWQHGFIEALAPMKTGAGKSSQKSGRHRPGR